MLDDKLLPKVSIKVLDDLSKQTTLEFGDLEAGVESAGRLGVKVAFEWDEEDFEGIQPQIARYISSLFSYPPSLLGYRERTEIRYLLTFMYRALQAQAQEDGPSLPIISEATYDSERENFNASAWLEGSQERAVLEAVTNTAKSMIRENRAFYDNIIRLAYLYRQVNTPLDSSLIFDAGDRNAIHKGVLTILLPTFMVYRLLRSQALEDRRLRLLKQ